MLRQRSAVGSSRYGTEHDAPDPRLDGGCDDLFRSELPALPCGPRPGSRRRPELHERPTRVRCGRARPPRPRVRPAHFGDARSPGRGVPLRLRARLLPGLHADPGSAGLLGRSGPGSRRDAGQSDPLAATAAHFAFAAPLALVASLLAARLGAPHLSAPGLGLAVASGALASGGGYAIWYAALRGLSTTRAALVQLSVPPLAALGGVLVLGEDVTLRLVLSAVAILGGIALAVTSRRV